jgi:hypothetical protein
VAGRTPRKEKEIAGVAGHNCAGRIVMNRKRIIFIVAFLLMAGTAGALVWLSAHKRLGRPGIKGEPIPGTIVMKIDLPETVLDFTSTNVPEDAVVLNTLPKDTSFAKRLYTGSDGAQIDANIILMGLDRTSIHKADYCLAGSGATAERQDVATIPIGGTAPYDLPVARWTWTRTFNGPNGEKVKAHGLYVFWFVADGEFTPSYSQYRRWLMWDTLRTWTLQRWAYISYQTGCEPGQEDAAFDRVAKLIAASVPQFQLPPAGARGADVVRK